MVKKIFLISESVAKKMRLFLRQSDKATLKKHTALKFVKFIEILICANLCILIAIGSGQKKPRLFLRQSDKALQKKSAIIRFIRVHTLSKNF